MVWNRQFFVIIVCSSFLKMPWHDFLGNKSSSLCRYAKVHLCTIKAFFSPSIFHIPEMALFTSKHMSVQKKKMQGSYFWEIILFCQLILLRQVEKSHPHPASGIFICSVFSWHSHSSTPFHHMVEVLIHYFLHYTIPTSFPVFSP